MTYSPYDYYPDDDADDEADYPHYPDAPEWQPHTGQCDHCGGSTTGLLGSVCACAVGQGAAPDECLCGPVHAR